MKLSEVIVKLKECEERYGGDIEVILEAADYPRFLPVWKVSALEFVEESEDPKEYRMPNFPSEVKGKICVWVAQ